LKNIKIKKRREEHWKFSASSLKRLGGGRAGGREGARAPRFRGCPGVKMEYWAGPFASGRSPTRFNIFLVFFRGISFWDCTRHFIFFSGGEVFFVVFARLHVSVVHFTFFTTLMYYKIQALACPPIVFIT